MKFHDLTSSFEQLSPEEKQKEEMLKKIKESEGKEDFSPQKRKSRRISFSFAFAASFVFLIVGGALTAFYFLYPGEQPKATNADAPLSFERSDDYHSQSLGMVASPEDSEENAPGATVTNKNFMEKLAIYHADSIEEIYFRTEDSENGHILSEAKITDTSEINAFFEEIKNVEEDYSGYREAILMTDTEKNASLILYLTTKEKETISLIYYEEEGFLDCFRLTEVVIERLTTWK